MAGLSEDHNTVKLENKPNLQLESGVRILIIHTYNQIAKSLDDWVSENGIKYIEQDLEFRIDYFNL